MDKLLITSVQRFSLHDGPGIRTTVFLKGCSICCPWCSNPENISPEIQSFSINGKNGVYGKWYTIEELVKECLKDKQFYSGKLMTPAEWCIESYDNLDLLPGGVTFSGGECLLQMSVLSKVCELLHRENVHVAIETSLFSSIDSIEKSLNCVDLYYVDVKILSYERCLVAEKGNVEVFLQNLDRLFNWKDSFGRSKPVILRFPIIGTYTDTEEHFSQIESLIRKYKDQILKIELIKEHHLADSKYFSLNLVPEYHGVNDSVMDYLKNRLESSFEKKIEVCKV